MVLTVSYALTPVPLLVQGGQYLLSLLKAGFNDVISETQRVMGTALLRRLLGLFGKFFTAPLSLSLLVKKPARGWRRNTNALFGQAYSVWFWWTPWNCGRDLGWGFWECGRPYFCLTAFCTSFLRYEEINRPSLCSVTVL